MSGTPIEIFRLRILSWDRGGWKSLCCLLLFSGVLIPQTSFCADEGFSPAGPSGNRQSLAVSNGQPSWPSLKEVGRVMSLQDYNTRVVVLGTTLLGCAGGIIGSFALLRKRALMGDALSHATLPGIVAAFMIATALGFNGKSLPLLLIGATITGLIGVVTILVIRNTTRLKEDTAMGAVLSIFFGGGVALLGIVQQMQSGHAAGLESFVYGKTASMVASDTWLIAVVAGVAIAASGLFYKELKILCFDDGFAGSEGFPVILLDLILMVLVTMVCIVGLQAVGLILMIALLVIPSAAARFWSIKMHEMVMVSALLGAVSGYLGATASALFSRLPSGAMIVLVCACFFLISMTFGPARGLLVRGLRRWSLSRRIARQHLLRALYEIIELESGVLANGPGSKKLHEVVNGHLTLADDRIRTEVNPDELLPKRSWSNRQLTREIERARGDGLLTIDRNKIRLTDAGAREAIRLTRQHRLWELYLINFADVAVGQVDRDADAIEHVLGPEMVARLERLLDRQYSLVPESPHHLARSGADSWEVESGTKSSAGEGSR